MKHELNSNSAILAKVFPNTWNNFTNLEWQYESIEEFLRVWLVSEWELMNAEEFDTLSMVERLTLCEWYLMSVDFS